MKNIIMSNPALQYLSAGKSGLRKNGIFLIFCLILFGGILYGSLSGASADRELLSRLDLIFQTNFTIRSAQGLFSSFAASFASSSLFIASIFLLGLSLWGGFLAVLMPLFKGFGYGLSVGYLYGAYHFKGVLYNLLVILPGAFLSSLVISAASYFAFRSTLHTVIGLFRSASPFDFRSHLKTYCRLMLAMLALCALSALLDMLCSLCFSHFFSF